MRTNVSEQVATRRSPVISQTMQVSKFDAKVESQQVGPHTGQENGSDDGSLDILIVGLYF
jgi:hypothetical protein